MAEDGNVAKRREFDCVEIPCMNAEQRAQYTFMTPEPTYNHLRVIEGEWEDDDGDSWFFARTEDNFIHKFPASEVRRKRKDLVDEFEARDRSGNSSPFDPSSNDVHPDSRVRLKITIHKGAKTSTSTTSDYMHTSSSESDGEGFASGSEDSDTRPPNTSPRMSTRASSKKTKELPYSPKKSHPRRKFYTHGDDDDDASVHSADLGSVRMTRQKPLARNTSEDPYVISSDSPGSEEEEEEASTIKGVKGLPLARLGIVHAMKDRDWDPQPLTASTRLHRHNCEKCGQGPLSEMKKPRRKRKLEEFEEDLDSLGGWLRCVSCPIVLHWGCATSTRQTEIMKSVNQTATTTWRSERQADPASETPAPRRRHDLDRHETTGFLCSWCSKSEVCMGCHRAISHGTGEEDETIRLLFRCNVCTRGAHYDHLPQPDDNETLKLGELASYYQNDLGWKCHDCSSFVYQPDKIIAWRPYPAEATESAGSVDYSSSLPREYLVKWAERSYKRVQWVPHMWLLATHKQRLRKFVLEGRTVKLLDKLDQPDQPNDDAMLVDRDKALTPVEDELPAKHPSLLGPVPDAERRINPAWRTVDRVLDVLLFKVPRKKLTIKLNRKPRRVESEDEDNDDNNDMDPHAKAELDDAFNRGEQPSAQYTETIAEWEKRNKCTISQDQIGDVVWGFFKWGDLGYEEATWDSPPRPGEAGYADFERAFTRFIAARSIPKPKGPTGLAARKRPTDHFMRRMALELDGILDLGQDPKFQLMKFQVQGFNWLCNNWWNTQHCILADEMGLGKTVQIATFLGKIIAEFNAFPALVVVPNSTITNWVREIERWAPKLKVVPFYGDGRARERIITYELQKFHIIVASYEAFSQGQDFNRVFKKQPRWEMLIVDEGQRLKNNDSVTFKKLRELNSIHRIIMTGTPLNNNIRELFNLMNFLDPDKWADLEQLEKDYQSESLDEERVKQLHERLRPYFLRRTKKEVLKLPPKNEVIVPLSMLPLQRDVYKSLYKGNTEVLRKLTPNSRVAASISSLRNILMQLRKCLQHPYLISSELEPENLSEQQAHERLIETSTKLLFLKQLLPQLKARGHRVLIFTQFSIALDILEEFLNGEKIKWLRLDGSTAQRARQEGIDEFNKPGSDVLVYMLTTRAGGAGINLWTADTVIMFDPDFNPHQDLQAIARAHRFGQTKTVLVFKLVVTDSVEEKIMQIGRKKMALDHLIVQTMEDQEEGGTDVKSILTHGAQALFEGNQREIKYSEADIADLITKTEEAKEEVEETKEGAFSFSFAKVWTAERAALAEMEDEPVEEEEAFADTMAKIEMEREKDKATEVSGRGVRRKAARAVKSYGVDEEDAGKKRKGKQKPVSDDDFSASEDGSESDTASEGEKEADPTFEAPVHKEWKMCGLCAQMHRPGDQCSMTESSDHLAQYRLILMTQSEHEPYEKRAKAIQSIEETLIRRGHIAKIQGQPLYLIPPVEAVPKKTPKSLAPATTANGTTHASSSKVMNGNTMPADTSNFNPDNNCCPICLRAPWHKMNKCPKVRAGPQSIASALAQLQASPHAHSGNTAAIINQLRLLLKFNESAAHPAAGPVAQVVSQQHINTASVPPSATLPVPGGSRHGPEPMQVDNDS